MTETQTLPDVMKALNYEAVLLHPVDDIHGKVSWGWIWYRHGEVAGLSPLAFADAHEAGENFCSLMDFRTVYAPVPEIHDPTVKPWSVSMVMVGQRGIPIYVVVDPQ